MFWLLTAALLSARPYKDVKRLYVAPTKVHDPYLNSFNKEINSVIFSSVNTSKKWIMKSEFKALTTVHNTRNISLVTDSVCDYSNPLECSHENLHWVLMSDLFVRGDLITVNMNLFDEDTNLIGSTSFSSYSVRPCPVQSEACVFFDPIILAQDTSQAIAVMFYTLKLPK